MSFFSKKSPDAQTDSADETITVRTMQDDLDAMNTMPHQDTPSQTQTPEQAPFGESSEIPADAAQTHPLEKVSVNQNPFITPEQQAPEIQHPLEIKDYPLAPERNTTARIQITPHHTSKLVISLTIVIILISVGGIYYFITTRNLREESLIGADMLLQDPTQQQINTQDSALFSTTTPNYLPIDTTNTTPQSIQTLLSRTAQQTKAVKSADPIEFFITDTHNDPVSFMSFAKLSGLALSQETLNALGEKFSLFVYTHNERPHIGFFIELKDKSALQAALLREEPSLPKIFSPFFLNETPVSSEPSFTQGVYKSIPLRYVNIRPETSLSIDYAIIDNKLVIATSMETHHALLDIIQ